MTPPGGSTGITDPLTKTRTMTYSTIDDLLTISDPLSHVTTFTYDSRHRKLSETNPRARPHYGPMTATGICLPAPTHSGTPAFGLRWRGPAGGDHRCADKYHPHELRLRRAASLRHGRRRTGALDAYERTATPCSKGRAGKSSKRFMTAGTSRACRGRANRVSTEPTMQSAGLSRRRIPLARRPSWVMTISIGWSRSPIR